MTVPPELFRNAIDLNRYSNGVARQIVNAYNQIILSAVSDLRALEGLPERTVTVRLRSILAQLKESLDTWSGASTSTLVSELQGLAELESDFVYRQLQKVVPPGARNAVRSVEISPQFAQSVALADPTQLNIVVLSDDLFAANFGAAQTFSLTARQGTTFTLPNGEIIVKAFRGLAESQGERFGHIIRTGLLTGETTNSIARRLLGTLDFGQEARSIRQLIASGGELTKLANSQVLTLVRTSVNQVANAASMQTYEANQEVTRKYRYIATLDTRTSAICRALDGKEFEYGKGPKPPQHFNCRSTIAAVIDYDALGFIPPAVGERSGQFGGVPANQSYGEWLFNQPRAVQEEALGKGKVAYFNRLAKKTNPRDAVAKLVRDDGSELTLKDLQRRYGQP